jgi:hypothetical protein
MRGAYSSFALWMREDSAPGRRSMRITERRAKSETP